MGKIEKTDSEWKKTLSDEQFHVLREKAPKRRLPENIGRITKKVFIAVPDAARNFSVLIPSSIPAPAGPVFGRRSLIKILATSTIQVF